MELQNVYKVTTKYSIQVFLGFVIYLIPFIKAQQAYCWESCSFNCPSAAPRLCPPEGILTYYDCCFGQGCCQYIKWPNLIFLIIIIIMLLSGCACCLCFLFTDARQRMFARQQSLQQQQQQQRQQNNTAQTMTNAAVTQPLAIMVDPITNYQPHHHSLTPIQNESIRSKSRSGSTPASGMIYHKQSTVV